MYWNCGIKSKRSIAEMLKRGKTISVIEQNQLKAFAIEL